MSTETTTTVAGVLDLLDEFGWDTERALDYAADPEDPSSVALAALRIEDGRQAPGSETALLTAAVDTFRRDRAGDLLDQLRWWVRAYEAYGLDDGEAVYDLLMDGDIDGAEALARGEAEA